MLDAVGSYPETYFQADRHVGPFKLDAFVAYTWDLNGVESQGVYPRFTAKLPLPWDLRLATHVGWQSASHPSRVGVPSYFDWSFGVRWEVWGIELTLAYVDTNLSRAACGGTDDCSARPVFTASRTFSTGLRTEERRDAVGRGY